MTSLPTITFGRTGLAVSPLCIGTSSWGSPRDGESQHDGDARIAEMASSFASGSIGLNFLDTSNEYGTSRSEELVGRALAQAGAVAAGEVVPGLVVQTKLDRDPATGDFSGDRMRRSIEETLSRLGVDRVQVLHLHDPENIGFDASMAAGGPVEALVAMKEQGLADWIGISGGPVGMLQQFVETDLFDALVTHNRYTILDRSASDLFDAATARGVGITNAAPYGAGVLTGDPRFAGTYGYRPISPVAAEALEAVRLLCDEYGLPMAAAALQFSMREERIHSTVVGVSSLPRLEKALDDAVLPIPSDFWGAIEDVVPAGIALDA